MKRPFFLVPPRSISISLKSGMLIEAGGDRFVVAQLLEATAVIQKLGTTEYRETSHSELIAALQQGAVSSPELVSRQEAFFKELGPRASALLESRQVSQTAVEHGVAQLRWIYALEERGFAVRDTMRTKVEIERLARHELKDVPRFTAGTLYKAKLKLEHAGGDPISAIPDFNGRGAPGQLRLHPVVDDIIDSEIKKHPDGILVRAFKLTTSVHVEIEKRNAAGEESLLPLPSPSTIERRLRKARSAYGLEKAGSSRKHAEREYRQNSHPRPQAIRPNDTLECDDVDMAVFMVCELTGLPWGRAYCTNAIDQFTRVPVGYDMDPAHRAYESAIGALADALVPPEPAREDLALVKGQWIGYGTPAKILLDNARYNKSRQIEQQSLTHALLLSRTAPYTPTGKSAIEHYNAVVKSDFCPTIPGWRGEKLDPDAIKHGMCSANQHLGAFRKLYLKWVVDVYLNTAGDDGYTPRQRWMRFYEHHGPAVRWTSAQIELLRMRPIMLTFRASGGLVRKKISYDCPELEAIRREFGKNTTVQAFYSTRRLDRIGVMKPSDKRLIWVPTTDQTGFYDSISEFQWDLIRKLCLERKIRNPSRAELVEAREALKKWTLELAMSPKMRDRQKSYFSRQSADTKTSPERPLAAVSGMVTELEREIEELDSIELEAAESEAAW